MQLQCLHTNQILQPMNAIIRTMHIHADEKTEENNSTVVT